MSKYHKTALIQFLIYLPFAVILGFVGVTIENHWHEPYKGLMLIGLYMVTMVFCIGLQIFCGKYINHRIK